MNDLDMRILEAHKRWCKYAKCMVCSKEIVESDTYITSVVHNPNIDEALVPLTAYLFHSQCFYKAMAKGMVRALIELKQIDEGAVVEVED